jgi:transcriptional regulator with XRE-family HTH domain
MLILISFILVQRYKTMKYNERIREIREDNSLTQQKIADLLHIGQRTYADYESGKTRIPVDNLLILARFYDVSMDFITGASNLKSEYPKV